MSRTRSKGVLFTNQRAMGLYNGNLLLMRETPNVGILRDYADYSLFTDDTSPYGSRRQFHACVHQKDAYCILGIGPSVSIDALFTNTCPLLLTYDGCVSTQPSSSIPWDDMVIELADDVRGRLRTKSLIGVTLKEFDQTCQMVKNPFGLLKRDWRSLAGRNTASRLARKGANLWLEGRYGWGSGYYDLCNFAKSYTKLRTALSAHPSRGALGERFARTRKFFESPGTLIGSSDAQLDAVLNDPFMGDQNLPYGLYAQIKIASVATLAAVSCHATDEALQPYNSVDRFLQAFGCDTASILPSLWEVIPYSFVVDWFVNNSWVRSLPSRARLTSLGVRDLGFSTKVEVQYQVRCVVVNPNISGRVIFRGVTGTGVGSKTTYTRCIGLPSAMSVFLGWDLSSIQATDLTALLVQFGHR